MCLCHLSGQRPISLRLRERNLTLTLPRQLPIDEWLGRYDTSLIGIGLRRGQPISIISMHTGALRLQFLHVETVEGVKRRLNLGCRALLQLIGEAIEPVMLGRVVRLSPRYSR